MRGIILLTIDETSHIFKLLGDKTRLRMVVMLIEKECCVCELVHAFDISQPAISQHLKKLKSCGIITEDKRKNWIYYALNTESKFYPVVLDLQDYLTLDIESANNSDKNCISCD